jgi:hypothetical protein
MTGDLLVSFRRDARHAARMLLRKPGFGAAVIAILALAIGANSAIFAVVSCVLLRPLPFGDAGSLVAVWSRQAVREKAPFNIPDFIDLRDQNDVLEGMAGYAQWIVTLSTDAAPVRLQGLHASAKLFPLLRVHAAAGRTLVPSDDLPGAPRVAVLSDGAWRGRFGANLSLLGRPIILDGEAYTVVGVLPPEFVLPLPGADLVAPLAADTIRDEPSGPRFPSCA